MHLYDDRLGQFIPNAKSGQIADLLRARFLDRFETNVSNSEYKSWRESLGAFADSVVNSSIDDSWLVLEYRLPLSSARVDCMVLGTDSIKRRNTVLIEFKQWDRCHPSTIPEVVDVGGIEHLHPSAQVRNYREYLRDTHSAFLDVGNLLQSCAFLHNMKTDKLSDITTNQYSALVKDSPAFGRNDIDAFARYLKTHVVNGVAADFVDTVLHGRFQPSKKLLDYVASVVAKHEPWQLLDNQQLVYNRIVGDIDAAQESGTKSVIIAVGGPGSGKSAIALQVLAAAARKGCSVVHATGSKAFTTNLRAIVGREGVPLFTYSSAICREHAKGNHDILDVVVCDEAHRLRKSTTGHMGKVYSPNPQIHDIIDSSKVSVFLLDDKQSVRANEVGSVGDIRSYAQTKGVSVHHYELDTQFRCAGSESYIRWVDFFLGLSDSRTTSWKRLNEYEALAFDDVGLMEDALRQKLSGGDTARLVAGFCWPWSDPLTDRVLVPDVVVGNWQRPWNKKPRDMWKLKRSAEPPESHPYTIWATQPEGFEQVGCIYSAQGFEFDYVGVIFGADLRWDNRIGDWQPNLSANCDRGFKHGISRDRQAQLEKLKNVYRVLCTRGMKGTYFCFVDPATRKHFEASLP